MKIPVALVEDNPRYRAGLEVFFKHTEDFDLLDTFGSGEKLLECADGLVERGDEVPWRLVLMDLELPGIGGIETTRRFKRMFPDVSIVVLTVFESPGVIVESIAAGADGYLLKKSTAPELLSQLRSVSRGGSPLTPDVARTVLDLLRTNSLEEHGGDEPTRLSLTDREQEVLRCFVEGLSYIETADRLGIALDTVRNHVRSLYRKLQVHSVAEAVSRAVRERLI